VQDQSVHRIRLLAFLLLAPVLAGCSGASDLLSKDAEWFSRPGRLFIRNISIETPPLSPNDPVAAADLVSADGYCAGMVSPGAPADANASTDGANGAASAPSTSGAVALGHTECDVVRGIGAPDSVNLSSNERGERLAVINYSKGQRAGIYTFRSGRLSSVERGSEPAVEQKTAKPRPKKKPAAT
jgi:hypothetical protein